MAQDLVRYQNSGDFHFVTFSCHRRQPHLLFPEAKSLFEHSLETIRIRYDFFVFGYVLMPEHVHLLVSEPKKAALSKAIQALKLSVAVQREQRPLKLKYMHRNPVTRGLVKKPEDWPWSSFHHYSTGEIGTVEVESWWTATRRESVLEKAHISKSRCGTPSTADGN